MSPEAAVGGPLVRDGDEIELDIPNRRMTFRVPDEERARRRATWTPRPPRFERGYGRVFLDHVLQAPPGVDFDFLVGKSPVRDEDSAGPSHAQIHRRAAASNRQGKGGKHMRRLIALTVAIALALPMVIAFGPAPARADNDTATNVALGLAAFAVFNQLMGPAPRPVPVEYRPVPVYREEPVYREDPVYREVPVYRRGHGYREVPRYAYEYPHGYQRVVPYPHGRYELQGDGYHHGYRWVWIPGGRHWAPPVPPLPPPPFRR